MPTPTATLTCARCRRPFRCRLCVASRRKFCSAKCQRAGRDRAGFRWERLGVDPHPPEVPGRCYAVVYRARGYGGLRTLCLWAEYRTRRAAVTAARLASRLLRRAVRVEKWTDEGGATRMRQRAAGVVRAKARA